MPLRTTIYAPISPCQELLQRSRPGGPAIRYKAQECTVAPVEISRPRSNGLTSPTTSWQVTTYADSVVLNFAGTDNTVRVRVLALADSTDGDDAPLTRPCPW